MKNPIFQALIYVNDNALIVTVPDDVLHNVERVTLVAQYPLEPRFQKGRRSKLYDYYSCRNCGFDVNEVTHNHCPKCGQRLTGITAGRRMTQEEEEEYLDYATVGATTRNENWTD